MLKAVKDVVTLAVRLQSGATAIPELLWRFR
jgi:hypothetical protein